MNIHKPISYRQWLGLDPPEIDLVMTTNTVPGGERRIRATWTPELAQDLMAFRHFDAEAELTRILGEEMLLAVGREVMTQMLALGNTHKISNNIWINFPRPFLFPTN